MGKREVKESPVERGVKEEYSYSFPGENLDLSDVFPSGTYAGAANELYEKDVNGAYLTAVSGWNSGSPSVSPTTFTTSEFNADVLEAGKRYRLECVMTIDGARWDWELYIDARI